MDANVLKDLMKNVGNMDLPKGKPKMMSVEVESIDAKPIEEGEVQGDPWPMVQEKLGSLRSAFDELEALISESYYPGEKEAAPEMPGPGPEMKPY